MKKIYNNYSYRQTGDYSYISSLEELRAARAQLKEEINRKGSQLSQDYELFREAISPVTYIKKVIDKIISAKFIIDNVINGFKFARSIIDKLKRQDNEETE